MDGRAIIKKRSGCKKSQTTGRKDQHVQGTEKKKKKG